MTDMVLYPLLMEPGLSDVLKIREIYKTVGYPEVQRKYMKS